jgi:hypothetical protein
MRTLAYATLAFSLITSGAAFADAIEVGSASHAPVFATESGNSSNVVDVGSAHRAPVFAYPSGNIGGVIEIGNASHAPVFARPAVPSPTDEQVAHGQFDNAPRAN